MLVATAFVINIINIIGTLVYALTSVGNSLVFQIGWQFCAVIDSDVCSGKISESVVYIAIVSLVITFLQFYYLYSSVNWRLGIHLAFSSIFGIVLGQLALVSSASNWIPRALGLTLLIVGSENTYKELKLFCLNKFHTITDESDTTTIFPQYEVKTRGQHLLVWFVGFCSGIFAGLFGAGGPPLIWYVAYIRLEKLECRATLAFHFAVSMISRIIVMIFIKGDVPLWSTENGILFAIASVCSVFTLHFGNKLATRINQTSFRRIIIAILMAGSLMVLATGCSRAITLLILIGGILFFVVLAFATYRILRKHYLYYPDNDDIEMKYLNDNMIGNSEVGVDDDDRTLFSPLEQC